MPFEPETCNLFIDSCDKKFSPEELFRLLIGVDESGCPFLKTNGATSAQVEALTAAIEALTAAIITS